MKAGGGGKKGGAYERAICTKLSLWASNLTRQDVFWRSAMSGGRANLKARRGMEGQFSAQAGDIVATHKIGRPFLELFCVDSKHYADVQAGHPFFGKTGELIHLFEKLREEAVRFRKMPMMIVKQNMRDDVVIVTAEGRGHLRNSVKNGRVLRPTCYFPRHDIWVYLLRDFLTKVDYEKLSRCKRIVKRLKLP